jgi:hypothetical protein
MVGAGRVTKKEIMAAKKKSKKKSKTKAAKKPGSGKKPARAKRPAAARAKSSRGSSGDSESSLRDSARSFAARLLR